MLSTALRVGIKASGAVLVGGLGYGFYLHETDEGTKRAVKAYAVFVPVVLHYRWAEARHKFSPLSDEDWEAMDERYAVPTVIKLGELQGMYCKYGQTAAGFTNTFGDAWIRGFRKLENEVPPRPIQDD
jgi:predicted unusual protein kinase regulating ubiquinone biosynthesis (AarF/ABC1/UbiB family)